MSKEPLKLQFTPDGKSKEIPRETLSHFDDYLQELQNLNDLDELNVVSNCLLNLSVIFKQQCDEYEKEYGVDYYNPLYGDIQTIISGLSIRVHQKKYELRK